MKEVIHTYAEIFKLVGIEGEEAEMLSESYLATVLRRTGEALADGDSNKEPKPGMQRVEELANYLNSNFEPTMVSEELGRQYISFYGEWSRVVLPLLPQEVRTKAEEMLDELGSNLTNNLKEND